MENGITGQVRELWAAGVPVNEIAKRIGCDREAVVKTAQQIGLIDTAEGRKSVGQPSRWWTDERIETLKRMIALRASSGDIAWELKTSRNAVIGKAHRLRVALRGGIAGGSRRGVTAPKPPTAVKAPSKPPPPKLAAKGISIHDLASTAFGPPVRKPKSKHLMGAAWAVLSLRDPCGSDPGSCRFPIGDPRAKDFRFCGALRYSKSYCRDHAVFDCRQPGARASGATRRV